MSAPGLAVIKVEFYDHKRTEHRGDYRRTCSECERLWTELLRLSKLHPIGRA